jgi:hypothetical protein
MKKEDKRIIGLAGPKGVGKSTFASNLVFEYYQEGLDSLVRVMSFATPLKQMLGCIVHEDYIKEDKERVIPHLGVSARYCLQTLGTEWGRNTISNDIWVNLARHRIEESPEQIFIIDDVRFDNEAKMILDMGGEVWNLSREGIGGGDGHVSESGISKKLITKEVNLSEKAATIEEEDSLAPNEQKKGKGSKGVHASEKGVS